MLVPLLWRCPLQTIVDPKNDKLLKYRSSQLHLTFFAWTGKSRIENPVRCRSGSKTTSVFATKVANKWNPERFSKLDARPIKLWIVRSDSDRIPSHNTDTFSCTSLLANVFEEPTQNLEVSRCTGTLTNGKEIIILEQRCTEHDAG